MIIKPRNSSKSSYVPTELQKRTMERNWRIFQLKGRIALLSEIHRRELMGDQSGKSQQAIDYIIERLEGRISVIKMLQKQDKAKVYLERSKAAESFSDALNKTLNKTGNFGE